MQTYFFSVLLHKARGLWLNCTTPITLSVIKLVRIIDVTDFVSATINSMVACDQVFCGRRVSYHHKLGRKFVVFVVAPTMKCMVAGDQVFCGRYDHLAITVYGSNFLES